MTGVDDTTLGNYLLTVAQRSYAMADSVDARIRAIRAHGVTKEAAIASCEDAAYSLLQLASLCSMLLAATAEHAEQDRSRDERADDLESRLQIIEARGRRTRNE